MTEVDYRDVTISGDIMTISGGTLIKLQEFIDNQKDLDPEFIDIVNKHFWDLLA